MSAISVINVASYAAAVLGGVALFVAPFTRSSRRMPRWTRVALWLVGPATTAWGGLGLTLAFAWQSLSRDSYHLIGHYKTSFGGHGDRNPDSSVCQRRVRPGILAQARQQELMSPTA